MTITSNQLKVILLSGSLVGILIIYIILFATNALSDVYMEAGGTVGAISAVKPFAFFSSSSSSSSEKILTTIAFVFHYSFLLLLNYSLFVNVHRQTFGCFGVQYAI